MSTGVYPHSYGAPFTFAFIAKVVLNSIQDALRDLVRNADVLIRGIRILHEIPLAVIAKVVLNSIQDALRDLVRNEEELSQGHSYTA